MLAVLLAACQPRPQPFRPEAKADAGGMLARHDLGGVIVRPVVGLPPKETAALADAMVAALQKAEIPASLAGGNRLSLRLDGAAARQGHSVAVDWRLSDAAGNAAGAAHAVAPASDDPKRLAADLSARSTPAIVALMVGSAGKPPASAPKPRRLTVWPVVGAPGDGDPALSRAMHDALVAAELPVADELTDRGLVIAGSVHVGPPSEGRQPVEILWSVLDPTGAEIAKLAQNNSVPQGSLDGKWGPIARMIADAAVPGVIDMLRQVPAESGTGGS
jgi:hypothetical protein